VHIFNRYFYILRYFLLLFAAFFTENLFSISWPLTGITPVTAHWGSWKKSFFALKDSDLFLYSIENDKLVTKEMYSYSSRPGFIKHFPIKKGDLLTAFSYEDKELYFTAFNKEGELIYEADYSFDYDILQADVRIDETGNPVCVFYYKNKNNHVISLFKNEEYQELLYSEFPVETVFLEASTEKIHVVLKTASSYTWKIYQKDKVETYQMPSHIMKPNYFFWENKLYLTGIDATGNLWRFWIDKNLRSSSDFKDDRIRFADEIIPIVHENNFFLLLPSSKTNSIYRIQYIDFSFGKIKGSLQEKKLFWNKKIHPMWMNNEITILLETEFYHLYKEAWNEEKPAIYDIKWRIDAQSKTPELHISWQTRPVNKKFETRYLLDQKEKSEPLAEDRMLSENRLVFENLKDGFYGFHLQIRDPETKQSSALYHLPIEWKYLPQEPSILLLNQVAENVVPAGRLQFVFTNPAPVDYYAKISSRSKDDPDMKLNIKNGIASIDKNLKPGKYYLHVKAKDPGSNQFSSSVHHLFFIDPFNLANEPTLRENTDMLSEIEIIRKNIRQHKDNPEKLIQYKKQLIELQKKLNFDE